MNKVAFLFPGQGAQYVGMGKDIYDKSEIAKKYFDEVFAKLDIDLKDVLFDGPEDTLKQTMYTQPGIVLFSTVLVKLMEEKGITPEYVAGHSLGEYAALSAGKYLSLTDTVKLAELRGKIMTEVTENVDGAMAAIIGLDSSNIESICNGIDGVVEAVNYNEPKQTVIAGERAAVEKACELLKEAGAKRALLLPVSGPFHSSLMKPAGEKLKESLASFEFEKSDIKLVANTTTEFLSDIEDIKEELYRQSFGPVKWVETMIKLKEAGVETFYEIGPGKVLKGLAKKIDKELNVINIEKYEDIENL